jgi:hypothetical protein
MNRALVVGCYGGVGSAVLALLEQTDPGRQVRDRLDALFLLDREVRDGPLPEGAVLLPAGSIESADDITRLVAAHGLTQVVDLSSVDTLDCTSACDAAGADFLCTSVEEWSGRGSIPTDQAIARLLPPARPALPRRSHLVGSGANPGIVNALVSAAIEEFGARAGVLGNVEDLGLYAILVTEEDTTRDTTANPEDDVFAMTWSPSHCLEELFEPRAFIARNGALEGLGHGPTARTYSARCGTSVIAGMAVPHEEISTLAVKFPSVEIGFIYKIPSAAMRALAARPERRTPGEWETRRLYPPWTTDISGEDRVGVLLCSRTCGELWIGFATDVRKGLPFGTNATQLQVAAGVVAGWLQLGTRRGIHFVEDLDSGAFVSAVTAVLGAPQVVYDPAAPVRAFADRATAGPDHS